VGKSPLNYIVGDGFILPVVELRLPGRRESESNNNEQIIVNNYKRSIFNQG